MEQKNLGGCGGLQEGLQEVEYRWAPCVCVRVCVASESTGPKLTP